MEFRWTSGLAVRLEGRIAGDDEIYVDYTMPIIGILCDGGGDDDGDIDYRTYDGDMMTMTWWQTTAMTG